MHDFEMGQPVRDREDGGDFDSQPDKRILGKEGTIGYAARIRLGSGNPPTAYLVESYNGESLAISETWLEPAEAPGVTE